MRACVPPTPIPVGSCAVPGILTIEAEIDGTWTLDARGNASSSGTTRGTQTTRVPVACYSDGACGGLGPDAMLEGTDCVLRQDYGPESGAQMGTYSTMAAVLTVRTDMGSISEYDYCVSGSSLLLRVRAEPHVVLVLERM